MLNKRILRDESNEKVYLTTYILDSTPELPTRSIKPAIIICPGGGYNFCSDREAEPIAMKYLSEGIHAFVLTYAVETRHPKPLQDVSWAVAYVREHAKEWHIDPDKIVLAGFSAGGHLAASLSTLWHKEITYKPLGISYGMNKPNASILAYPVISGGVFGHGKSFENLLGLEPTQEEIDELSLELQVSEHTPPTFLWHTGEDTCVPVENTLLYANALRKKAIPFELYIYQRGSHGSALCNEVTSLENASINRHNASWIDKSIEWLKENFKK